MSEQLILAFHFSLVAICINLSEYVIVIELNILNYAINETAVC
jgi:hypothetical protein